MKSHTRRMVVTVLLVIGLIFVELILNNSPSNDQQSKAKAASSNAATEKMSDKLAIDVLNELEVKGRAAKTGYTRSQFGDGWEYIGNCDTRNIILNRDLIGVAINQDCKVQSGTLNDPYTGRSINFQRGADTSSLVQIDHVVALSNAWQTGAQQLSFDERVRLANDPLELLAVDGQANQTKANSDAATWLPSNKAFRCQYVARQIAVKSKYKLWVTVAEKEAMQRILKNCPSQAVPDIEVAKSVQED